MQNIFLISAAHHYIQVEQALLNFGLNPEEALVWFIKTNQNDWPQQLIKEKKISNYKISESWKFEDLKKKSPKIDAFLQELQSIDNNNIRFFYSQYSSDYSLLAINVLKPKDIILMDEGTASFSVCKKRKKSIGSERIKLFIKSYYYKRLLTFPKHIKLFTQYDLDAKKDDEVIRYKFKKEENNIALLDNQVALLGSSMAEVGMLDEDYYLELLSNIKSKFPEKQFLYFSHRKEGEEKKQKIRDIGFEIVNNEIPFEFYFESLKQSPAVIASFFSPTLLTLELKFENIPRFIIYKFDTEKLHFNTDVVNAIFKSYEGNQRLSVEKI